jgi:hypothetical protein
MKTSMKSLLVAAAMTGLLGAATVVPAAADDQKPATTQTDKDKHSCKGANGCSGKDAKAKKSSTTKDKKADTASKDKNSCKGANGCSSKEEKKN